MNLPPTFAVLAALESNPAPAGRSSPAGVAIILLCLFATLALAARWAIRRFK